MHWVKGGSAWGFCAMADFKRSQIEGTGDSKVSILDSISVRSVLGVEAIFEMVKLVRGERRAFLVI